MDIQINSHPINYELGNEREIGDVIASISRWAGERDLVLVEALIDNESYSPENLPGLPLENVKSVNCIIKSKADLVGSSLEEALEYCRKAHGFIRAAARDGRADRSDMEALAHGAGWLVDLSGSVFPLLGVDPGAMNYRDGTARDRLEELRGFRDGLAGPPEEHAFLALCARHGTVFESMGDIFRMLLQGEPMRRLTEKSIDSPDAILGSLRRLRGELQSQRENIAATAAAYGAGKDGKASERLQAFTDFMYHYMRTSHQYAAMFQADLSAIEVGGVSLEEKNRTIDKLLGEMVSALEHNDIIGLSDILEYELMPALEGLELYIDALSGAAEKP